jgi:hypothetical protein
MNLERGLVVVDSSGLCVCVHHAATRTHNILAQGEHEYVSLPTAPHASRRNNNTLCKREAQRSLSAVSPHTVNISDSIRVMLLPEEEQTKHVVLSHRHLAFHEAAQPDRGAEPAIKPSRWGKFSPRLSRAHHGKIIIVSTNYHKQSGHKDPFFLATFAASTACCCGTAAGTRTG